MKDSLLFLVLTAAALSSAAAGSSGAGAGADSGRACPITNSTNIIYSTVKGVGPASKIWVQDLLWWWKQNGDASIDYMAVTASDLQNCDLESFPNLKVYINPGGDAYDQLTAMGVDGREHIISFVQRDQQKQPSAYVGFCAGGYIAAHDYLWESMYEGPGYYNYQETPPLSIFPFTLEGSIVDINDDQFGDQSGSKYRLVNVSNGQQMLYYGGSTFGYSGAGDPTDPSSELYDPEVEVLVYYSDFYGFQTSNIPAAWRYRNMVMTSVHPEADNCTFAQDSDCPPAGTMSADTILQNRAWLCEYINQAAQTSFRVPPVPVAPVFETAAPHTHTPRPACYSSSAEGPAPLFCEDFDAAPGTVPAGLSPQFQRNQSDYNLAHPWNTSYISSWGGVQYPSAQQGNGYAVAVPQASTSHVSIITSKAFSVQQCSGDATLSFFLQGKTVGGGGFSVKALQMAEAEVATDPFSAAWMLLHSAPLSPPLQSWQELTLAVPLVYHRGAFLRVEFLCASGSGADNFCALDSLTVTC